MKIPFVTTRKRMSRRRLLQGAGVTLGLPFIEAMSRTIGDQALAGTVAARPKRFVAICATLGFHTPFLFPEKEGGDYEDTPYTKCLADHRADLSLFSGLSHPKSNGNSGHASELTWLTSAPRPGLAGFRNTVSIDQLIASEIGIKTRFPSLVLSTSGRSMSWTGSGVEIPGETIPSRLFKSMFIVGSEADIKAQLRKIERGRSILDALLAQTKILSHELSYQDKQKLEQYLTAVRDLEFRLQQSEGWATRPKPVVDRDIPKDISNRLDAIGKQSLMYDMMVLALQSDSTRIITFQLSGMNAVPVIPGVRNDWHNLSHHSKDDAKIDELRVIEEAQFNVFSDFLTGLKQVEEGGQNLLDHTAVLYGSNLGNASSHNWRNLPIVLAGGGYRHGRYVAHDPENNTPFANMFVPLAQRMGVEIDKFGSSTAESIRGLDLAHV
ncbi:MAG: DUF1552 domain-containing protein [Planctomycetaceae bacterium]|jgi:hypothetical protein|nr:DUF1552 domain-containing protein [Planctomycetaceae bacterium]MBT4010829.1 DUF1552 domain-containing protein [Planctomycetaceae bacterium]MBT4724213.1 DUF1552 domain-containing protein [Planctomycetaceae bacterium]MBT5126137.1 DUF1552 domain-containing protein [Planctomycetaceae bacterium]MBT5597698.1 DUF1552 domain-containing protein [Planctomycetaceae bacterium]